MKFKHAGLLLLALFIGANVNSQTDYQEKENIEYVSSQEISETLQQLQMLRTTLPDAVDHTTSKYMSPVVNQSGGSCGSASRISHMFTFEINNYRDLSGKQINNRYPSHFTWLLTGQNSDKENMAIFNGIPNVRTYGTPTSTASAAFLYNTTLWDGSYRTTDYPEYGWMNGYDKWRAAMDNRLEKTANIKVGTDEAIEYIKWWMYNHLGDDSFNEGGVVGAPAATNGWDLQKNAEGKYYTAAYGEAIDHGVVFSGYDDNIWCDMNGDGVEDEDELGAFILMNSWGTSASNHNKGCVYVPYSLAKSYGGGLSLELYYIRKNHKPLDVFRIKMDYNERCNVKLSIGVSSNPNATVPDKTIVAEHFNYAGLSPVPLLGRYNNVINKNAMEFGFDLTDLISIGVDTRENYRYFLVVETKSGSTGTGSVQELEVLRYNRSDDSAEPVVAGKIDEAVTIAGAGKKIIIPVDVTGIEGEDPQFVYVPQSRMRMARVSTQETTGEGAANGRGIYAIDGDESTYWHSAWSGGAKPAYPHFIVFEVDSAYTLTGFEYLPRQNNSNGRIGDYKFFTVKDARDDGELVVEGTFENSSSVKRVFFDEPIEGATMVKLANYKTANGDPNTCMAEFKLFYKPKTPNSIDNTVKVESSDFDIYQTGSNLYVSGLSGNAIVTLYNLQGQKVLEQQSTSSTVELDVANIKGTYLIQVISDNINKSKKIFL
ncbi:hypothetical protein M2138_000475 [Dysgonomonadaceae bacterium PH5-43]|nr:hypothetical protein [Dysgonomonadaceae bacterium PH5-43]